MWICFFSYLYRWYVQLTEMIQTLFDTLTACHLLQGLHTKEQVRMLFQSWTYNDFSIANNKTITEKIMKALLLNTTKLLNAMRVRGSKHAIKDLQHFILVHTRAIPA